MKWIKILLTGIIVSLFYFPVNFTFFPIVTKNLLAAVGLLCVLVILIRKKEFSLPWRLVVLLILSSFVSIVALFSITFNQTPDTSYVSFIRSTIIWTSAAFAVCCIIWLTHRRIDIPLVINYLAAVGVFQCAITMAIHYIPAVQVFVDATFTQGQDVLKDMGRLYGIGAFLDVGGSRFAGILIGIAFLMEQNKKDRNNTSLIWLVLAFATITVIGNMIARTTLVGTLIGLAYIVLMELRNIGWKNEDSSSSIGAWCVSMLIAVPLLTVLYNSSPDFHDLLRFGFEGFFSLFEKGEWDVSSNTALESMVVWPEELRTWIIGDGYFANQRNDPNYIGDATTRGFYMGTDIGYLRFIFYFGVVGLLAMSAVMVYTGVIGAKFYTRFSHLFIMGVASNFVVWLKVATDMFPFLVFFACAAFLQMDLDFLDQKEKTDKAEETVPLETS